MLIDTTASACVTGQTGAVTSSAIGARRLGSVRRGAMRLDARAAPRDRRRSAARSGEAGCAAKYAACSPVPLAISSTVPRAGRTRRSTARIGSRLRATAGDSKAARAGADAHGNLSMAGTIGISARRAIRFAARRPRYTDVLPRRDTHATVRGYPGHRRHPRAGGTVRDLSARGARRRRDQGRASRRSRSEPQRRHRQGAQRPQHGNRRS